MVHKHGTHIDIILPKKGSFENVDTPQEDWCTLGKWTGKERAHTKNCTCKSRGTKRRSETYLRRPSPLQLRYCRDQHAGEISSKLREWKFPFKNSVYFASVKSSNREVNPYLLPNSSMISLVRVDLLLLAKASDAAFLNKTDPAMHPITVGFIWLQETSIQRKYLEWDFDYRKWNLQVRLLNTWLNLLWRLNYVDEPKRRILQHWQHYKYLEIIDPQ